MMRLKINFKNFFQSSFNKLKSWPIFLASLRPVLLASLWQFFLVFRSKTVISVKKPSQFSLTFFTGFLIFSLTSCSFWERQASLFGSRSGAVTCDTSNKNSTSTFYVDQITSQEGKPIRPIIGEEEDNLYKGLNIQFKLQLRTCLTDTRNLVSIEKGVTFVIEYFKSEEDRKNQKSTPIEVITDHTGCIQWEEEYDFKYKREPSWIVLERKIKGGPNNNHFIGEELVQMAVNPWLSQRDQESESWIFDLRCEYSGNKDIKTKFIKEPGLSYLRQTKPEERPLLWAPTAVIQINELNEEQWNSNNKTKVGNNDLREAYKNWKKIREDLQNRLKNMMSDTQFIQISSLKTGDLTTKKDNLVENQQIKNRENQADQDKLKNDIQDKLKNDIQNIKTELKTKYGIKDIDNLTAKQLKNKANKLNNNKLNKPAKGLILKYIDYKKSLLTILKYIKDIKDITTELKTEYGIKDINNLTAKQLKDKADKLINSPAKGLILKYIDYKKNLLTLQYIRAKLTEQESLSNLIDKLQKTYKRYFTINAFIDLKYRYLDSNRAEAEVVLNGGSYEITSQLLLSNNEQYYRIQNEVCKKKDVKRDPVQDKFHFECEFSISNYNQNSQYMLALTISSPDLPFKTFQGIYPVDKFNFQNSQKPISLSVEKQQEDQYQLALKSGEELSIIEKLDIKPLDDYADNNKSNNNNSNNNNNNKETSSESTPSYQHHRAVGQGRYNPSNPEVSNQAKAFGQFNIHNLLLDGKGEYKLSHIETANCEDQVNERETAVTRTVVFMGEVCLKDILEKPLKEAYFNVYLQKGEEEDYSLEEIYYEKSDKTLYKTDGDGCISIPIKLKHNIYDRQHYFRVTLHFDSPDRNQYGQVRLALSPWQRAFQAFQNAQHVPAKEIRYKQKVTDGKTPVPELIINQFRSINLYPSYGLDKLLSIHLFHRVYLLFQPFIRRPDNLALGLNHLSRELLRDGHYLVRVLLLRNPQETGVQNRTENAHELDKERMKLYVENSKTFSLEGAKYITHTDSVARAEANFINFYMPLYISTKQFYYIASRNLLVVEIYPADPSGFVYDEECEIDPDKTDWRIFTDHELDNRPYVGAMNIQNWVNWNLLQPLSTESTSTDDIIDEFCLEDEFCPTEEFGPEGQREMKSKYRHFDFSPANRDKQSEDQQNQKEAITITEKCTGDLIKTPENEIYGNQTGPEKTMRIKILQNDAKNSGQTLNNNNTISEQTVKQKRATAITQDEQKVNDLLKEGVSGLEVAKEVSLRWSPNEDLTSDEELKEEATSCHNSVGNEFNNSSHVQMEAQKTEDFINDFNVLDNFAKDKSLSVVDFEDKNGYKKQFIKDLNSAYKKTKEILKLSSLSNKTYLDFLISDPRFLDSLQSGRDYDTWDLYKTLLNLCYNGRYKTSLATPAVKQIRQCERSILTSYLEALNKLSKHFDPLVHFFEIALKVTNNEETKNLIKEQINREDDFKSYYSTYKQNKELIKQIMEEVIDSGHPKRYLLKNLLLKLVSSPKGKQELFDKQNKWDGYCSQAYGKPYEHCYNDTLTELLGKEDYFEYVIQSEHKSHVNLHFDSVHKNTLANQIKLLLQGGEKWNTVFYDLFNIDTFNPSIIESIINEGIKEKPEQARYTVEIQSFTKSLCVFWFESYIKDYLKEKQKLSAYTNYVKNFDYYQMAVNNITPTPIQNEELMSLFKDIDILLEGEKDPKSNCYHSHVVCSTHDYCKNEEDKSIDYCLNYKAKDPFCEPLLAEKCKRKENKNLKLCKTEGSCNSKIRDYCKTNPDQKLCEKYSNRCYEGLFSCIEKKSNPQDPLFKVSDILNYKTEDLKNFAPFKTCLRDPFHFFKFENKMIVHDISKENVKYKGGFLRNFFVSANHSIGTYKNWTAQRGASISIVGRVTFSPLKFFEGIAEWFSGNINMGVDQAISSNTSKSGRRAIDSRVGEGLFLTMGQAKIKIGVTKFQKCLVIKPRPNAFTAKWSDGEPQLYQQVWTEDAEQNTFKKVMLSRPGLNSLHFYSGYKKKTLPRIIIIYLTR